MRLCKVQLPSGEIHVAELLDGDRLRLLPASAGGNRLTLAEILAAPDPRGMIGQLEGISHTTLGLTDVTLLAPVDLQEVWAAGVTYKRSQEARERESEG